MREAVGGISLFQIVILFVLLFAGVMCLTINQSKAFAVKDEIITIIENAPLEANLELNSNTTALQIAKHLEDAGYRTTGNCPSGWTGYNRSGTKIGIDANNAAFCIKANDATKSYELDLKNKCAKGKCTVVSNDFPNMAYYDVVLFYELDIPVIKYFMNFKIYGSTKVLFG